MTLLLGLVGLALLAEPGASADQEANREGLRLKPVGRFNIPTFIAAAPQDTRRLYIVERDGTIRVLRDAKRRPRPFLDIRTLVSSGGERGLLSMAFRPDYAQSGLFYVYYTARNGALTIAEYRRSATDPEQADPRSARRVMAISHPHHNHNSGQLQFGPDGYMYAGTGDGGGSGDGPGNAQDLRKRLGKILCFDPSGTADLQHTAAPTNPFVGRPEVPPEIWAKGFRNPWRFSFDRANGDLYIGDVGQNEYEEVDYVRHGRSHLNFGWNRFEGRARFGDERLLGGWSYVPPVAVYSHKSGCSVTGGYVARGPSAGALRGRYVYGDYCSGTIWSFRAGGGRAADLRKESVHVDQLSSFGEDTAGNLYAVSQDGPVYRLVG